MVSAFIISDTDVHTNNWGFAGNGHIVKFDNDAAFTRMTCFNSGVDKLGEAIGSSFPSDIPLRFNDLYAFNSIGRSDEKRVLTDEMLEVHKDEKYYVLTKALILRGKMFENFASTTIPEIRQSKKVVSDLQTRSNEVLLILETALLKSNEYLRYFETSRDKWIQRMQQEFQEYNSAFSINPGKKKTREHKKHRLLNMDRIDILFTRLEQLKQVDGVSKERVDLTASLDDYLYDRESIKIEQTGQTKEYLHGFFFCFQYSFSEKKAAVLALKSALTGENVDLKKHLPTFRNGKLGQKIRAFVKAGYGDDIVGAEVRTVSDFIQALQNKNASNNKLAANPSN